jgi:hypothetical protein
LFSAKKAEIRLKTVEYAQLNSATDFGGTNAKIGEIFSKLAEFSPNRRKKTNHESNFGQIGRNSARIGGGNLTARIRPFLNEFQPFWPKTKLLCKPRNRQPRTEMHSSQ